MKEAIINDNLDPVEDNTKVLIAVNSKSSNSKLAVTSEQYKELDKSEYNLDGIIIRNEDKEADLLFATYEVNTIAGEGPDDIPETDKRRKNYIPGTFDELDGEYRTQIQLDYHEDVHEEGCAVCEAIKFGWLPSAGEMSLLKDYKEDFNTIAELIGATNLSNSEYWTSTQYSDDYMWSLNVEDDIFQFWRSKGTTMKVRPCKSSSEYKELLK